MAADLDHDAADAEPDVATDVTDAADSAADADTAATGPQQGSFAFGGDLVTVHSTPIDPTLRRFTLTTTHPLRDGLPAGGTLTFDEAPAAWRLRSTSLALDAFYALAQHERGLASVSQLQDPQWGDGKPLPCPCWQTGEKWPFAWTRDSSYAIALGLALHDPLRAQATLRFLLSQPQGGGSKRILQDTGTGGGWPVSTDRVVWARAAWTVALALPVAERTAWAAEAAEALSATLADDLAVAWDAGRQLLRGETSFLDWREQTYPSAWALDATPIARTFALSTNVLWWEAWRVLAQLRGLLGDGPGAAAAEAQADVQRKAMQAFWDAPQVTIGADPSRTLPPAWLGAPLSPAPATRADTLAVALAAATGLVDAVTGRSWLARLPFAGPASEAGPAVVYPPARVAIYHNRAAWPFVTGHVALAAAQVGAPEAFAASARALVRYGLLNLSHMENLAWPSGANWLVDKDGALDASGPVVNSRRQLWSVAAALAVVDAGLFGIRLTTEGVRVQPFVPAALAAAWAPQGGTWALQGVSVRGSKVTVALVLPAVAAGPGALKLAAATLGSAPLVVDGGGVDVTDAALAASAAAAGGAAPLTLTLAAAVTATAAPPLAPEPPAPAASGLGGDPSTTQVQWTNAAAPAQGVSVSVAAPAGPQPPLWALLRDGAEVGTPGGPSWLDVVNDAATFSHCWSVVGRWPTGMRTRQAATSCDWGPLSARLRDVSVLAARDGGGPPPSAAAESGPLAYQRPLSLVGDAQEVATFDAILPAASGPHAIELLHNSGGGVATGLHAAGLRLRVERVRDGALVHDGGVTMAHSASPGGARPGTATGPMALDAAEAYRVRVLRPAVASMANLARALSYSGPGGKAGAALGLRGVRLLLWHQQGPLEAPTPALDGNDDLAKTPAASQLVPGITLAPWERVSLSWDARWLHGVVVSQGFEDPARAYVFYLQVVDPAAPAPQTSEGMSYLGLTPKLPFTPTIAIGVRSSCDLGDGYGPWCGVFARDAGGGWQQRMRLAPGAALGGAGVWVAADKHTLSFRIPRAMLGAAALAPAPGANLPTVRLAGHLVYGGAGQEWKDVVPPFAMPWKNAATGYLQGALGAQGALSTWAGQ